VRLIASTLLAGGGETTARLLTAMLRWMGERPDLQKQLRDSRELLPNFIEEVLRLETPLQSTFRLTRVPVTIGGVRIPAGTTVMLLPAAANRDPRQFEAPAEFRLGRPNWRQHLSFGFGVHSCAGAPLARAEGRVSAERLLDRMADIRISEKHHGPPGARRYEYPNTYMIRGVERLHLEFTPVA
jgi:cytochrome P450